MLARVRFALIAAALAAACALPAAARPAPACPPLLDRTAPRLQDGQPLHLCQFAGKVLLVVNTASYCGFTPQFAGLQKLHARYGARGLVILGFPSDDFRQEDPAARKTAQVCFDVYGVKFPMFAAGPVRGRDAQPLFKDLATATGREPRWNFNKYLIGRNGKPIAHFDSAVSPESAALIGAIEAALTTQP